MSRLRIRSLVMVLGLGTALACGPTGTDGGPADGSDDSVDIADEDGDGISDEDEGRASSIDTDSDGVPDFEDGDSDGDGISDAIEAGDADLATAPYDSDADGTPDYRDLDSDDNGLTDGTGTETTEDLDEDGVGDWADLDDDGDYINDAIEIATLPNMDPPDTDGDGTPDYRDIDSDADTIADADEGAVDWDDDNVPSYRDDDSDGDCLLDSIEAGDSDVTTAPFDTDLDGSPDFLDADSDADGLADAAEDPNCNGLVDTGETSPVDIDTDGDGVTDLVEVAAETDPADPTDNPQANGDFVFVVPYEEPPSPDKDDLDFSTDLQKVDVYVLMDLSGSMADEADSVRDNLSSVLTDLTCPPAGNGDPNDCIPELWSGSGSYTYAGRNPFVNRLRLQPNPNMVGPTIPDPDLDSCPDGGCAEPHYLATWAAVTGKGSADASTCTGVASFAAAPSCSSSPAGMNGVGYPCFRSDALPVILLATDEPPSTQYSCPGQSATVAAANAMGAKIIGIEGSGVSTTTTTDLEGLATGTGAVTQAGVPLVFDGSGVNAANAIKSAIQTLSSSVPLDISAHPVDEGGDAVDAVTAFVDHLETLQLGTAQCEDGLSESDTNSDGFADLYVNVLPGTPVCWRLVPKSNTTVPATDEPQMFEARIDVYGDNVTLLDDRKVFFLVPPVIDGPSVD